MGSRQVWLIALAGLIYFTCASLYSFYGKVAFDFSSLIRLPAARTTVMTQFTVGLSEEILFRGVVLHGLARVWGNTKLGMIGSVFLASLLFAVLHITQVFTHGVSLPSALLLTLETWIVSIWWGALVLLGGSIWSAAMLHFVVSAVVAVQGLTVSMVESDILAYTQILWFSTLLGMPGIGLLVQGARHPSAPEAPQPRWPGGANYRTLRALSSAIRPQGPGSRKTPVSVGDGPPNEAWHQGPPTIHDPGENAGNTALLRKAPVSVGPESAPAREYRTRSEGAG